MGNRPLAIETLQLAISTLEELLYDQTRFQGACELSSAAHRVGHFDLLDVICFRWLLHGSLKGTKWTYITWVDAGSVVTYS